MWWIWISGCTDATACNYNASATDDDSCSYANTGYDCDGVCILDSDGDEVCDGEISGCTDATALIILQQQMMMVLAIIMI